MQFGQRQIFLLLAFGIVQTLSHGRLCEPASTASMWRFPEYAAYDPEPDYDDTQGFCGGFQTQHEQNGGKCGVCGDNFQDPEPRAHENGGRFGKGVIVRDYQMGGIALIRFEIKAYHLGYVDMKLCPDNSLENPATDECLDQYPLKIVGTDETKFYPNGTGRYEYYVQLPQGVTCTHCMMRWQYTAGNNWGICPDGSGALGCGPQETFRGCADVSIS